MDDLDIAIMNLGNENKNCSQIIALLFEQYFDKKNTELTNAMYALGNGMFFRKQCGILTACICILSSTMKDNYGEENIKYKSMILDFSLWFKDTFVYTDCIDLVENFPADCPVTCTAMIKQCFIKLLSTIEENEIEV